MIEAIIGIVICIFFLIGAISGLLKIYNFNLKNWLLLVKYIKKSREEGNFSFTVITTSEKIIITGTDIHGRKTDKKESLRLTYK